MKLVLSFLLINLSTQLWSHSHKNHKDISLQLNKEPPILELSGALGGRVSGQTWSSSELKGKMHVLFYVAPAHKDMNKKATDAIREQNFSREHYASVAVVNMAASSWPNWIIAKKIASSQKEFPNTIYVKDVERAFVKSWGLKDNSNNVVLISSAGKVLYSFQGKLPDVEIKKLLSMMQKEMNHIRKQQIIKKRYISSL